MDGVSAALVDRTVTLLLDGEEAPAQDAVADVLKPFKMTVRSMEKAPSLPF